MYLNQSNQLVSVVIFTQINLSSSGGAIYFNGGNHVVIDSNVIVNSGVWG